MNDTYEVKQIAAQILSGMLANPHIYTMISDERARGQQEQEMISVAVKMAKALFVTVDEQMVDEQTVDEQMVDEQMVDEQKVGL